MSDIAVSTPAGLFERVPERAAAEAYLLEAEALNPGAWVTHSRYVALAAEHIAAAIPAGHPLSMEPGLAHRLGLLHDIGRREGVHNMVHITDGYHYLTRQGWPGAARICLTHSFPDQDYRLNPDSWDGSPEDFAFVEAHIPGLAYTPYDRLIQLCDCLCMAEGIVLMEKRLVDICLRYGFGRTTLPRWRAFFAIRNAFDQAIPGGLYRCLPGVVETTFHI